MTALLDASDNTLDGLIEAHRQALARSAAAAEFSERSDPDTVYWESMIDAEGAAARALLSHVPKDLAALRVKIEYIKQQFMPPATDDFRMIEDFAGLFLNSILAMQMPNATGSVTGR